MAPSSTVPVACHKAFAASPRPVTQNRVPILIVGAGMVGMTTALDLGRKGHRVVVLNKLDAIPVGSKAICFSKRTLDIWDRLGVGGRMVAKGVVWNVGKVFWGADPEPLLQFDMLPLKNQKMPGFINLQQYYAEEYLYDELCKLPNVELRWGHRATTLKAQSSGVIVGVETAEGAYEIEADWLIAADGHNSSIRRFMGLDFEGRVFEDNFLIADVKFDIQRPSERWFWFEPPWPGASALMHKQPDGVWRFDFQLGWNIDRKEAVKPENVEPFVRGMFGPDVKFTPVWYSIYTFQCRRMKRFVHGRVVFAGDSAHLVSPFGARGFNGGIADAENLAWKLDLVLKGLAPESLLESYNDEAIVTADENILNSSRATDFITPKNAASKALRDAVLELAKDHAFARPFINSGRLSTPVHYPQSLLNTPDAETWNSGVAPGSPALDAPIRGGWLLGRLGETFAILSTEPGAALTGDLPVRHLRVGGDILDDDGLVAQRYALEPGTTYLIRPDQYVAARWRGYDPRAILKALATAGGRPQ